MIDDVVVEVQHHLATIYAVVADTLQQKQKCADELKYGERVRERATPRAQTAVDGMVVVVVVVFTIH